MYANTSRALAEATQNGFDNVEMRDGEENIVEFGSANLFIVKDDRIITPEWNKTFLNGITKQRVISLLKEEGIDVTETKVTVNDLFSAKEVFSTGNFGKVLPVTKVDVKKLLVCIKNMLQLIQIKLKHIYIMYFKMLTLN